MSSKEGFDRFKLVSESYNPFRATVLGREVDGADKTHFNQWVTEAKMTGTALVINREMYQ